MLRHRWPGNVRELNTAVQHAVVMARGEAILPKDLPAALRLPAAEITARETSDKFSAGQLTVKEAEKQLVIHALQECEGNRTKAAEKLGMSRRTLHRKLHEYHLESY
jgi:DNA-binding NtrC family response regulator